MAEREDLIMNPVPKEERTGWTAPLFNVLGTNIAISALMVGINLLTGLTFFDLIWVAIVGNLILMVIMIIQGNIGSREGVNTYVIAKGVFGDIGGTWIISLILAITSFGWFGIQAGVAGLSIQQIFPGINVTVATIIIGVLMFVVATLGFGAMAIFNYIAIPPLLILILWSMIKSLNQDASIVTSLSSYVPSESMSYVDGIGMVVGLIIVGAVISPDYLRYTRGLKDVFIVAFFAVALVTFFQQIGAAVMSINQPTTDITEVFQYLGFSWIAFLILVLAAWSTNLANAYSGGLALKNVIPKMKRTTLTLIAGLIGTILAALNIIDHFQSFLGFLSMTVSSLAGVIWVEYYIINKKQLIMRKGVNWKAIMAWIFGVLVAYLSTNLGLGIPAINSIIASGLFYYLIMNSKKTESVKG